LEDLEMNKNELDLILEQHRLWLYNDGGKRANLRSTDLSGANLSGAILSYAILSGANLSGADLDFSQLNLSCKGLDFKIDERLAKQLVYHVINLMQYSELDTSKIFKKEVYKWLKDSHLVTKHNLPELEEK
jgi:hypothetical protein